jgi:hypothetical protein
MPRMPLSKRAASGLHAVGDRIRMKGCGFVEFEIVSVADLDGEIYYKVRPLPRIYGIPMSMVSEIHHKEKMPLEAGVRLRLSKRAAAQEADDVADLANRLRLDVNKLRRLTPQQLQSLKRIQNPGLARQWAEHYARQPAIVPQSPTTVPRSPTSAPIPPAPAQGDFPPAATQRDFPPAMTGEDLFGKGR